MYLGLVGCLTVPLLRDFFALELPPAELLAVAVATAIPGCLGIELIDRLRRRRDRSTVRPPAAVADTDGRFRPSRLRTR
jgi:hypothetical protein